MTKSAPPEDWVVKAALFECQQALVIKDRLIHHSSVGEQWTKVPQEALRMVCDALSAFMESGEHAGALGASADRVPCTLTNAPPLPELILRLSSERDEMVERCAKAESYCTDYGNATHTCAAGYWQHPSYVCHHCNHDGGDASSPCPVALSKPQEGGER